MEGLQVSGTLLGYILIDSTVSKTKSSSRSFHSEETTTNHMSSGDKDYTER